MSIAILRAETTGHLITFEVCPVYNKGCQCPDAAGHRFFTFSSAPLGQKKFTPEEWQAICAREALLLVQAANAPVPERVPVARLVGMTL